MKLWLVQTKHFDYDEYDAFVVRAHTANEALTLIMSRESNFNKENTAITEVSQEGEVEVILGSFNAG